jgi:hypothetical protein
VPGSRHCRLIHSRHLSLPDPCRGGPPLRSAALTATSRVLKGSLHPGGEAVSPVGGPAARRLRGASGRVFREVHCSCGVDYTVPESAVDLARCPNKKCHRPTREIRVVRAERLE